MKAVEFKEANCIFKGPPNSDVQDLAAFRDGSQIISCWELSDEDIEEIKRSKRVYLSVMGAAMPPVYIVAESPFVQFKNPFAFCHVQFKSFEQKKGEGPLPIYKTIFVGADIAIPSTFRHNDRAWYINTSKDKVTPEPSYDLKDLEWVFLLIDGKLKVRYISNLIDDWVDVPIMFTE